MVVLNSGVLPGLPPGRLGRSADEQLAAAIEVVCEHAAAVLGRDGAAAGPDAGRRFADSRDLTLSAVELL